MPEVRLVDLEIFKRFSLALRQEHADAGEVLEVLEASAAAVRKELAPPKRRASTRKAPVRKGPVRKSTVRKSTARTTTKKAR